MIRYRYEKKYLVRNGDLEGLRRRFMPFLEPDGFTQMKGGIPEYTVRSIYFDSKDSKSFYEKIEGLSERKKMRVRGYGTVTPETKVVLEIKRKLTDRIHKNRVFIPYQELEEIVLHSRLNRLASQSKTVDDNLSRFLFNIKRYNLAPKNLIVYDREAYQGRFNPGVRVTFDKRIRQKKTDKLSSLFSNKGLRQVWKESFILEVKYFEPEMPSWAKSIVGEFRLKPEALSKYTNSVEHSLFF
ncbi:MAG: polyphosphate polymerase domain-containing protein [Lunatimonas sp.]|uniref:polyphosphate polymerase domain-containing protein n=1 Tax=Lunatimonas sp. TaxID=2060141 RepID=UPI00263AA3BC|nr:polyphosphate polymerase domain-containing protein [Lunatimonas sp.]MCC5937673.1 polyphosphate polymerase domain-containing protein [Lunatimonas sp.]